MNSRWKKPFIISVFIGGIASLFASRSPDGLDRVAEQLGFVKSEDPDSRGIFSDYGIGDTLISGVAAGIIGASVVFAILYMIGKKLFETKESISPDEFDQNAKIPS